MTVSTDKDHKSTEKSAETATKARVRVSVKSKRVVAVEESLPPPPPPPPSPPSLPLPPSPPSPPVDVVVVKVKRKKVLLPPPPEVVAVEIAVPTPPATTPTGRVRRTSSRATQMMAPSMGKTVASTAAKASYTPAASTDVDTSVIHPTIPKDDKLANNWKSVEPGNLSDAELLAMPDSEYMNKVQLAAFRLKLVELKRGILENAGETSEHLREDNSVVPDPADRATIEEEHAIELRTRDRERKLLKKIEQSIARIESGDYGYCDETGEAIGVGRLLARPTATLSLEAQQRRELRQKMCGN